MYVPVKDIDPLLKTTPDKELAYVDEEYTDPPIPTPPVIINAPVVVFVEPVDAPILTAPKEET